jgi:Flp pilus assembly protein CpaB
MANHTTGGRRTATATRSRRSSLAPLWREQLARFTRPGWARTMHIRRAVAALLVVLAGILALRGSPATAGTTVVVAARDLSPGHVLVAEDLRAVQRESRTVPSGALTAGPDATGRSLAAPVRSGETLTDVRLLGPALAAAATGVRGATSVPVRLTDGDIADLLHPGDAVDVLALGEKRGGVAVIASGAAVLTVQPGDPKRRSEGRVVVLGLPAEQATTVAAASLSQSITVTFR